jgi:transcriptional regulator with XRE-family HTH domain
MLLRITKQPHKPLVKNERTILYVSQAEFLFRQANYTATLFRCQEVFVNFFKKFFGWVGKIYESEEFAMTLYDRVRRLCMREGINISNLGQYLPNTNVSRATISHWKTGSVPKASTVMAMADYFDVSPEYIMSGADAPTNGNVGEQAALVVEYSDDALSEQEAALLKLYKGLDVIGQARLLAYASEL